MNALRALERFARAQPEAPRTAVERCAICNEVVGEGHGHLADLDRRSLCCVCRPCALLFSRPDAARGRYRLVPDRVRTDNGFSIDAEAWGRLGIPVLLAFVFFDSALGRWVAVYPSVAGPTQAELPPARWSEALAAAPLVRALAPDVEALLVRGRPGERSPRESFLVPIDQCYRLVGLVRRHWRGFSGGAAVWSEVDGFFAELRARARPLSVQEARGGPR